MTHEVQETETKVRETSIVDGSLVNIASELMRDQLLNTIRMAEMKQLKIIENYIDNKVLCDVLEYVKNKKTCETFDVIDNLDQYDPKEICKILDFLDAVGKIKLE